MIRIKVETPRLLDKITQDVQDFRRRSGTSEDCTLIYTVANLIESIDGK